MVISAAIISAGLSGLTEGLAIGGFILGVIVTGATLGTAGPAGAALAIASLALITTNFALSEGHVYEHMDPDAAKGLQYGLLITGMVCGLGAGGVGALSNLTSSATTASTAVGEAALEGGTAAAQAGTAAEAADADTPMGQAAKNLYEQFVESEDGSGKDFSAMLPRFEKRGHN